MRTVQTGEVYLPPARAASPRKEDAVHYPNKKRWKLMWSHLPRKA